MKPLLLRTALIAIVLAVTGVPLAAQKSFRVNPVAGYRVFGEFTDRFGNRISVQDSPSFGAILTWMATPQTGVEFGMVRQDSDVSFTVPFGDRTEGDVKIDQWTLGAHRELPSWGSSTIPFGGAFVGLTRGTSSDGDGSSSRFTLGFQGGVNALPENRPLGLRFESRAYFTLAGQGGAGIGCGVGGCSYGFGSRAFVQVDFLVGIVFAFGDRSRR